MKTFLVLLLGLIPFLSPAQDTLVHIKPSTARWFLEADDERWILREKDSISNELINNYKVTVELKDQIIKTYQNDSITFRNREKALTNHIEFQGQIIGEQNKKVNKMKFGNTILMGATGGAILGSSVPMIGTVLGAAGGAVLGTIVALTRLRN